MTKILDEIRAAREALSKGDLSGAFDRLAGAGHETFQVTSCPDCGAKSNALLKAGHVLAQCEACGASWGKRAPTSVTPLVKSQAGNEPMSYQVGKTEVISALWEFWRTSDGRGCDAFEINNYAATGVIRKSLLEAVGVKIPDEETLQKSMPEIKKSVEDTLAGLNKSEVLNLMFEMFKTGEAHQYINRHSMTKFDQFGFQALDEETRRVILRKAGKDPDALSKGPKLEDQEGMDPDIADPGKGPREEPKARFGNQQPQDGAKRAQGIGDARLKQLVFDNPANGEAEGLKEVGQKSGEVAKAAVDVSAPAPSSAKLGPHFLFATENPGHPDKVTIHAGHEQVLHGLRRQGMNAREVKGKYGGKAERSIMVHSPKAEDLHTLHHLAAGLGQEAGLSSDGETHRLHFYHGENAGKYHEGKGTEFMSHEPEDAYTEMTDPDSGKRSYFRHNIDFGQLHDHVTDGSKAAGETQPEAHADLPAHEDIHLHTEGIEKMGPRGPNDPRNPPTPESLARFPGPGPTKTGGPAFCPKCQGPHDPKKGGFGAGGTHGTKEEAAKRFTGGPAGGPKDVKKSDAVTVAKALKSLAPAPTAPKPGTATLMKKPMAKGIAGPKPGTATAPKPAASAKAITTPTGTKVSKAIKPIGLKPLGAPAAPMNAEIQQKQAADPAASAHSLTAPKATLPKFDPKSIGIGPGGKKAIMPPVKKSEALAAVQAKLEKFSKSASPSERAQVRRLGELYTRVAMSKSEDFAPEDLE